MRKYFTLSSTIKDVLNDEHLKLIDLATECIGSNELNVAMDYYDEIINYYTIEWK